MRIADNKISPNPPQSPTMSDKLARTLQRFQSRIDKGEFYEAHQTLRTISNRYINSKQYDEAINLVYEGALILLKNKEYASGSDLIMVLIDIYQEASKPIDTQYKGKLIELINYLPNQETSLVDLSKKCINWSKSDTNKFGDHDLHELFGIKFLNSIKDSTGTEEEKNKLFAYSELHLILGNISSLNNYIEFLYDWYKVEPSQDPGIYLARAIINYSYLKNIDFVKQALTKFLNKLTKDKQDYETVIEGETTIYYYKEHKLINFLQLLVITLTKTPEDPNIGNKFMKLYNNYKAELSTHQLNAPIEYLGRFYFGLNLGTQNNQNMLANLMGGLFK